MDTEKAKKASNLLCIKEHTLSCINDIEQLLNGHLLRYVKWINTEGKEVTLWNDSKYISNASLFMSTTLEHLLQMYKTKLSEINIEIMSL